VKSRLKNGQEEKKEALINGDFEKLIELSKGHPSTSSG
jgi:hypothetical protein